MQTGMLVLFSSRSIPRFRLRSSAFTACALSSWSNSATKSTNKVQSYISTSNDPYLNLSFEHYLLEKSPIDSAILFLYVNHPCVVIGRNQNPWLEVNLNILDVVEKERLQLEPPGLGKVDLVRRRSGGGTVFHDEGNVNWTVICPTSEFTRDKHAEMVVRALRTNGIERARVNERHDIVLDKGPLRGASDNTNLHRTPYTVENPGDELKPVKVSGSAYKLTRGRALHHGTCLLSSPNLHIIPHYLHAPGKPYMKAKGVESVSSPVGNIGLEVSTFKTAVREEFAKLYAGGLNIEETVGDEVLQEPVIRKLWDEMKTAEWTFGQTPQFTFSSHPTPEDERVRPDMPAEIPSSARFYIESKHGQITESALSVADEVDAAADQKRDLQEMMNGRRLYDTDWTWAQAVGQITMDVNAKESLSSWLDTILPLGRSKSSTKV